MQVLAKLSIEAQELIDAEPGQQKRHCQTRGVKCRQHQTTAPAPAGRRQTDDAPQDWPNAGGPAGSECHPQRQRAQHAAWLLCGEHSRVPVERADFQQPNQVQAKAYDDETTHDANPGVAQHCRPYQTGSSAECQEDHRQTGIESEGIEDHCPARRRPRAALFQTIYADAGHQGNVARHQRQDAGRQKRCQAREKSDSNSDV